MNMDERFFDVDQETLQRLKPIDIQSTEPLVTIEEATTKLQRSVYNISDMTSDAKSKLAHTDNELTIDEATAIYLFTVKSGRFNQTIPYQLNRALRTRERNQLLPWLSYLKILLSALKKLPSVNCKIWRFTHAILTDSYKVDCFWSGFSSCTESITVVKRFLDFSTDCTVFEIECTNAKRIQNYSSCPEECEVLLMPDTYLQILEKRYQDRKPTIVLRELGSSYLEAAPPIQNFSKASSAVLASQQFNLNTPPMKHRKNQAAVNSPINSTPNHPACRYRTEKYWLDRQYHQNGTDSIMTPQDLYAMMQEPPMDVTGAISTRVIGSMIGMALGDALGAHVEFRPHKYLKENPVRDLQGGGTWGLAKGQFTDDTSMALCLANSLVCRQDFIPYDQLVRYKWWNKDGYMSSTGQCFDIGMATSQSLQAFETRQKSFASHHKMPLSQIDLLSDANLLKEFNVYCSEEGVAGNGALMRLSPVPLFFYKYPVYAVEYSGVSGIITHGDLKAYDACRYYGALIVAALRGETKKQLLDDKFFRKHEEWFNNKKLCPEVMKIAEGSFKKKRGYKDGIRGKGYIINALEAALWAFWSDDNSFKIGALNAVNLGDDTDTTAAIYGQLAGAYYTYEYLPPEWVKYVYAHDFLQCVSKWIVYEGEKWHPELTSWNFQPLNSKHYANVSHDDQFRAFSNLIPKNDLVQATPPSRHRKPSSVSQVAVQQMQPVSDPNMYQTPLRTQPVVTAQSSKTPLQGGLNATTELESNPEERHDQTRIHAHTRLPGGFLRRWF